MVGAKAAEQRAETDPRLPREDSRGAQQSQLRAAHVLVRLVLVMAVVGAAVSLAAASVTGWAISISPAGWSAQLDRMQVSTGVSDLVSNVLAVGTVTGMALLAVLLVTGACLIRRQPAALSAPADRRPGDGQPVRVSRALVGWWGLWIGAQLVLLVGSLRIGSTTLATTLLTQLTLAVVDAALVALGLRLLHLLERSDVRRLG